MKANTRSMLIEKWWRWWRIFAMMDTVLLCCWWKCLRFLLLLTIWKKTWNGNRLKYFFIFLNSPTTNNNNKTMIARVAAIVSQIKLCIFVDEVFLLLSLFLLLFWSKERKRKIFNWIIVNKTTMRNCYCWESEEVQVHLHHRRERVKNESSLNKYKNKKRRSNEQ